jgi:hypothetical protein
MRRRAKSPSKGKANTPRSRASKPARAKKKRADAVTSKSTPHDPLDDLVDAAAHALGLPLDPAWRHFIKASLATTFSLAASFADFPLPDEAEPAPVFVA